MDIEEVHIYRHLDAVVLEIFTLLIDPVHDHPYLPSATEVIILLSPSGITLSGTLWNQKTKKAKANG